MKTKSELCEERGRILDRCQEMLNAADGSMSETDTETFNAMLKKADDVDRLIASAEALKAAQSKPDNPQIRNLLNTYGSLAPSSLGDSGRHGSHTVGNLASGLVNLATGEPIPTFRSTDFMAGRPSDLRIGENVFNWLRGDGIRNAAVGGVDSSGGFMITPSMAPFIVDLARAKSVVNRLGAQSIDMTSPELRIGTVTGDPTPQWAGELQAVTASDVTFGLKTLRARKMVTLLFASDEWLMDAANGAALLESVISAAMAAELDKKVMAGAGSANEPLGIIYDPNRQKITGIGGIADYQDPVNAIALIMAQNYQGEVGNLGWVLHPTIAGDYQLLVEATTNAPLAAPQWVNELRKEYTTSLGTGTAIVGDFSQVLIGTRMNGMRFEILDAGTAVDANGDTLNAITQVGRWIRMTWYGDSVVLRPNWLCALEGITT